MNQQHQPTAIDQDLVDGIKVCAQQIQMALLGIRPVDLNTIRAIQHMAQFMRMADLRLGSNALPPAPQGPATIEGEVIHA